jgi:hypothetical protein
MRHGSRQNIRDGLNAAMGMPGKAVEVILRNVIAEVVEEQKWIEIGGVAEAEGAAEVHACPFECGLGFTKVLDGTDRHATSPPGDEVGNTLAAMFKNL